MFSRSQWLNRLKSWVPRWLFNETKYSDAVYESIAQELSSVQSRTSESIDSTYIDKAIGSYLDLIGSDRAVSRRLGEDDLTYAARIKTTRTKSDCDKISLMNLINSVLINGTCVILDDFESEIYLNRDSYLNRGFIFSEKVVNGFTVIVEKQIHDPYSFLNRENFINFDYIGQNESDLRVFEVLIDIINSNKAFGTMFRIVERV